MSTTIRLKKQTKERLDKEIVGTYFQKIFSYDEAINLLMNKYRLFNQIKKRDPKVKELAAQIERERMTKELDEQILKELEV